jgi:hypothetical protein
VTAGGKTMAARGVGYPEKPFAPRLILLHDPDKTKITMWNDFVLFVFMRFIAQ